MSTEQGEAPLQKFREEVRRMKDAELEKKRRAETGEKEITWNPHFEKIHPELLTDEDRITFEELGALSNEEFKNRRNHRMRDYAVKPGSEEVEKIMKDLGDTERKVMERLIKSGQYAIDTPEAESVDTFWQYMANEIRLRRKEKNGSEE